MPTVDDEVNDTERHPLLSNKEVGAGPSLPLPHSLLDTDSGRARSVANGLYFNFVIMSLAFSCNHGCVVSCLAYATAELGNDLGGYGSGCLYVFYALTAFFLSKPIVSMVGPKNGLLLGVVGYCVYIAGFLFAVLVPAAAWPVFIIAASIGGIAGGLLWPSQGRYFARNAKLYADNTNIPVEKVNSTFAGIFATSYLGLEMVTKVLATVIFLVFPSSAYYLIFSIYTVLAVLSVFVVAWAVSELEERGSWDFSTEVIVAHVGAAAKLVASDVRLTLMLPFQISFGFTSSFVPYYILGTVIAGSDNLGSTYVGLLSALIVLAGSLTAVPSSWIANTCGKPLVMSLGGTCLAFAGFALLVASDQRLGTWEMIIPYLIVYGIGRGTWENTNKAVIADFFVTTPEHTTAAFASVAFFNGFAGAVGYFTFSSISRDGMAILITVVAIVAIASYLLAAHVHANKMRNILDGELDNKRGRSASFNSEVMLRGVFPPDTKGREPIINILLSFAQCPSVEQMESVCDRLLFYERCRSAVVQSPPSGCGGGDSGTYMFVDLGREAIDLHRDHLHTVYADSEEDMMKMTDQIIDSQRISELDGRPLWKLYRMINKDTNRPSMILFRIHHALGDGISLVGAIVNLFENVRGEKMKIEIPERMGEQRESPSWSFPSAAAKTAEFVRSTVEVLALPQSRYDSDIAFTAPNRRNMVFGSSRKTIFFPTLKLSFVKDIKNRAGVTVNDVLLTATAGAIRRYSILKGDPVFTTTSPSISCRALLPVAFPRKKADLRSSEQSLRNLWSFVSAPLPMEMKNSVSHILEIFVLPVKGGTCKERLLQCKEALTKIKFSPTAFIQLWIQNNILSWAPDSFRQKLTQDLFSRHSIVFSNLPGPAEEMYLCGEKLLGMQAVFPNLLVQVIIISYAGKVFFNMSVDDDLVDLHAALPDLYLQELMEMAASFGVPIDQESMLAEPFLSRSGGK